MSSEHPMTGYRRLRRRLRDPYLYFARLFFDPLAIAKGIIDNIRGVPYFLSNLSRYRRQNPGESLQPRLSSIWYRSFDRFAPAGAVTFHYFYQDLWAASLLHEREVREHVDVGSRVDGFVAHVLPFCRVTHVDIRPFDMEWEGFSFRQGMITEMPFGDDSVPSLSSLHVIEHVGLGRYGDPVDAHGHSKAAAELVRILAPGGTLLLGTPVGRERVWFDAHRVFDPRTILDMFSSLTLESFSLVDDRGGFIADADLAVAAACDYGCGLFEFTKK